MAHYRNSNSSKMKYNAVESYLKDILLLVKPSEQDWLQREKIIGQVASIVGSMESLKGANTVPFGSFVSNLYSKWDDLDVSVDISSCPTTPTSSKRKRKLLCSIQAGIQNAGQEVDDINDAKLGTLNSYSLSLLVIFHLQTCEPPVLPPLKNIYEGNVADPESFFHLPERYIEQKCATAIASFKTENTSSVFELLVSFFEKFTDIGCKASRHVFSTSSGQLESTSSKPEWIQRSYKLMIEDPFDRKDNTSRAVAERGLYLILDAFTKAYVDMSSYPVLSNRGDLAECLVGPDLSKHLQGTPSWDRYMDVTFTDEDLTNIEFPHQDLLVISAIIGQHRVHRILIGNASAANLITQDAFERMNIGIHKLLPFRWVLLDFSGNKVDVLGRIILPLTLGQPPKSLRVMASFLITKGTGPFNVVLGGSFLGLVNCIISFNHLMLKFRTPAGVGHVQGNQQMSRKCLADTPFFVSYSRIIREI